MQDAPATLGCERGSQHGAATRTCRQLGEHESWQGEGNAIGGLAVTAFVIAAALGAAPATAATIFTETFNYTVGSNLAGQNGGSGFSGAWSGGDSTIVAELGGTGNAVQIGSSIASRPLSATASTAGTSIYLTYLMNSSDFFSGNYRGISLWNGGTEEMFLGIPWQTSKFGFDAHAGNGTADIRSVDFTPATNTSYLIAVGLVPIATSGKVDVKMWATSNLAVNPNTLVAGTPNASLLGVKNNFSFNTLKVNGDYAGSLKVAGIVSSPWLAPPVIGHRRLMRLDGHEDRVQGVERVGLTAIKCFDGGLDLREREDGSRGERNRHRLLHGNLLVPRGCAEASCSAMPE